MLITNKQKIDLGVLKFGSSQSFQYKVSNSSSEPITVSKLILGCNSCTVANMSTNKLAPNEEAVVNVTFTPGSTGIQNKNINIQYQEGNTQKHLELKFTAQVNA